MTRRSLAALAVVAAAGALSACGIARRSPTLSTTVATHPLPTVTQPPPSPAKTSALPWPTYGADNARLRAVAGQRLRPPFRHLWTFHGHALLEFPPVIGYGGVFEEAFDGHLYGLDPATGRVRWRYAAHLCGWSSPALADHLLFATFIGHPECHTPGGLGSLVAFSPATGHIRWRRSIGPSESSPLVSNGTVYIGDQNGHVYAFDAHNGRLRWNFDSGAPIKASVSLADGRIFIGNYAGEFFALSARTGRVIWRAAGFGNFYSTAAVSDGRVYVGSLDDHVYAFSAATGAGLWSFGTGGYVYASPAVWRGLVLVGSFDGNFYALDRSSGSVRWRFGAGAPISGAASVVDGIVYLSTVARRTYALDVGDGRPRQRWPDGKYSPAVAGNGRLYLVGMGRIYALSPRTGKHRSGR